MSFTGRLSTSPASVQRDYGLLQAPSTSYRPFQGLEDDVSERDSEDEEEEEDRQRQEQSGDRTARRRARYSTVSSISQSSQTESSTPGDSSDALDEEEELESDAGAGEMEDGMSAFSNVPKFSSRAPSNGKSSSASRSDGVRGRRSSGQIRIPSQGTSSSASRPSEESGISKSQPHAYRRRRRSSAAGTNEQERGLAERAKELFLGGEAARPPVDVYEDALQSAQQQQVERSPSQQGLRIDREGDRSPVLQHPPPTSPRLVASPRLGPNGYGASLDAGAAAPLGAPTGITQPHISALWSLGGQAPKPNPDDVAKIKEEYVEDGGAAVSGDVEAAPTTVGSAYSRTDRPLASPPAHGAGPSPATERTPLLPNGEAVEAVSSQLSKGAGTKEIKTLLQYSFPIWGTHLLELSLNVVTVFSLGHLGTIELGAASLASMTANVTGFSVVSGFVSALDSLLPAAYASAHPWTVGVWTQRMGVILSVLLVPMIAIWWNTRSILLALGQDPTVASLAAQYLFVLSFALPAYAGFETLRRYLQAQGLFSAPTIAVSIASAINVPLNILLVYGPDSVRLGFLGAPVASLISYHIMLVLGLLQCYIAPRDAWSGFSYRAFDARGLKICWTLGLASTGAVISEWWSWEVAGLMTSWLGTTPLAAQSVLLVTSSITYQLPYAISVAAAVRVGNLLGANQPRIAKLSSHMAGIVALGGGLLNSAVLVIFRNQWGFLFSSEPEVVRLVSNVLPLVAAFQVADSISGTCGGILRGVGKQHLGAYINMVSYYVFGLPLAFLLIKTGSGLGGIWWGLTLGLYLGAIGASIVVSRIDWYLEAKNVQERMEADAVLLPPVLLEVEADPIAD